MLFTPSFSENEIIHFAGLMAAFLKAQREKFSQTAEPLPLAKREVLRPFFSDAILNTTLFCRTQDEPVESPDFLATLHERGVEFSLDPLHAVTFIDVIVSYKPLEPRVEFHELVHAVQYQKLGHKQFAYKYMKGLLNRGSYEKIPLEVNARTMDEAFTKNPSQPFSVEQEVQRWINENKF
ncbi:MAG TPA: hypothetical protein VMV05_02980 [bacterium]|nr:hypothetical protein [bacterium]